MISNPGSLSIPDFWSSVAFQTICDSQPNRKPISILWRLSWPREASKLAGTRSKAFLFAFATRSTLNRRRKFWISAILHIDCLLSNITFGTSKIFGRGRVFDTISGDAGNCSLSRVITFKYLVAFKYSKVLEV